MSLKDFSVKKVIIINSEFFGRGDDGLGQRLMGAFLRKLWAREDKPEAIICYNSGVKLMAQGSAVLDAMMGLYDAGVDILACGTCVDFYNLNSDIAAGRISNMDEISSILMSTDSVVTI
jgi:selenium metabolism protein YedF